MNLYEPEFRPVPLAAISPRGWLAEQLRIQANGLSGHLDRFWPDIAESAWIGGTAEGWERMPYWLDGVIPLAWLLRDEPLQRRIGGYLDYILEHQHDDGWLGPRVEEHADAADLWSQALALKMLEGYHDATADDRVPRCVERALRCLDRHIDRHPLSLWGQYRWFEFLVSIWWLHERTGERWLIDLAMRLRAQGFDWQGYFRQWPRTSPNDKGRWSFDGHVVNNAMALKEGALWWRLTGDDADRYAARHMMAALDRHHGMPTGVFTGDECLAGTDPSHGTELCAVAEYLYSLEWLIGVQGDTGAGGPAGEHRLQRPARDLLPGHVGASVRPAGEPDRVQRARGPPVEHQRAGRQRLRPGAQLRLLHGQPEPGVARSSPRICGCARRNGGSWRPPTRRRPSIRRSTACRCASTCAPTTRSGRSCGSRCARSGRRASRCCCAFPAGRTAPPLRSTAGARRSRRPRRSTRSSAGGAGETPIVLSLPMAPRIVPRPNGAVCVARGPLLYALRIGERWQRINRDLPHREPPHADWEVHPTTAWNFALDLGDGEVGDAVSFSEHPIGSPVFSPDAPPVSAAVSGRRVAGWTAEGGSAGPMPRSPVDGDGGAEKLTLIPYGCSNLRIAEFPVVGVSHGPRFMSSGPV